MNTASRHVLLKQTMASGPFEFWPCLGLVLFVVGFIMILWGIRKRKPVDSEHARMALED
jgi:hypothetical protein